MCATRGKPTACFSRSRVAEGLPAGLRLGSQPRRQPRLPLDPDRVWHSDVMIAAIDAVASRARSSSRPKSDALRPEEATAFPYHGTSHTDSRVSGAGGAR